MSADFRANRVMMLSSIRSSAFTLFDTGPGLRIPSNMFKVPLVLLKNEKLARARICALANAGSADPGDDLADDRCRPGN